MANDYYGKIGFRFRPEIERPDPKWAKKLMEEDYSTPYLSDGMMKPVSYTHLDVYKRQEAHVRSRFLF